MLLQVEAVPLTVASAAERVPLAVAFAAAASGELVTVVGGLVVLRSVEGLAFVSVPWLYLLTGVCFARRMWAATRVER